MVYIDINTYGLQRNHTDIDFSASTYVHGVGGVSGGRGGSDVLERL